jgi:hypothetical protein
VRHVFRDAREGRIVRRPEALAALTAGVPAPH